MKKITVILTVAILVFGCLTGCKPEPTELTGYLDGAERPEISAPEINGFVAYPEKPASEPVIDTAMRTSVSKVEATGTYALNGDALPASFSYSEIESNWDYLYFPVENFQSKYANLILELDVEGIEKISIQAVYYEMYEAKAPAVTIHIGNLSNGEQKIGCRFGENLLLDEAYQPVAESKLRDQTVIGLLVFLDSNPTQISTDNRAGSGTVKALTFCEDDDPALDNLRKKPAADLKHITAGSGYEVTLNGGIPTISYTDVPRYTKVSIPVGKFTSAYSKFNIDLTTSGVRKLSVAVAFDTGTHTNWQPYTSVADLTIEDGTKNFEIDFSSAHPVDTANGWAFDTSYFIKNFMVTGIDLYLDTISGAVEGANSACTINSLEFVQTVADDAVTVGKNWTTIEPAIELGNDLADGGIGSLSYTHFSGWNTLDMPVLNYKTSNCLEMKIQAPDGLGCIGLAFGDNTTLLSTWSNIAVAEEESLEGGNLTGTLRSVAYDEATKIYTLKWDFRNCEKVGGIAVNEKPISLLKFYLNDPSNLDAFEGTRTLRFVSIEFKNL